MIINTIVQNILNITRSTILETGDDENPPPTRNSLLLEDSNFLLFEDGGDILLER